MSAGASNNLLSIGINIYRLPVHTIKKTPKSAIYNVRVNISNEQLRIETTGSVIWKRMRTIIIYLHKKLGNCTLVSIQIGNIFVNNLLKKNS